MRRMMDDGKKKTSLLCGMVDAFIIVLNVSIFKARTIMS